MTLKKKEDQSRDTSVLTTKGIKISMRGDAEKKCGVETEGKAFQRLSYVGIYHIISHQTLAFFLHAKKCLLTGA